MSLPERHHTRGTAENPIIPSPGGADFERLHVIPSHELNGVVDDMTVSTMFSAIAGDYYKHKVEGNDPGNLIEKEPLLSLIADNGNLRGKGTVLEVGGGTGWLTYNLLKRAKPEKIIFNELCPTMIEIAEKSISPKHGNITFLEGSMANLKGIESESVNTICSANAMDCVVNVEAALKEQFRVLAPGGRMVALIRHPLRNFIYAGMTDKEGWYLESWSGTGGKSIPRYYRSIEKWMGKLYDAGFTNPKAFRPFPQNTLSVDHREIYDLYKRRPGALILIASKD